MEWYEVLVFLLGIIVFLMVIGMLVVFVFFVVNIIGVWIFMGGDCGVVQFLNNGFGFLIKFVLVLILLFLLMGEIFFYIGFGGCMFNVIDKLLGCLLGCFSYVIVLGGIVFLILFGLFMGFIVLLGLLMVLEMIQCGYKKYMSVGLIFGIGGFVIIILLFVLVVFLVIFVQIDVFVLLIVGIILGLILVGFYIVIIWIQIWIDLVVVFVYDVEFMQFGEKLCLFMIEVVLMVGVMVVIIVLMI